MSNRIREIGKELDIVDAEGKFYTPNYEMLAESIIRECAELAGCNGHVSGFSLGDLIKEHFGLEDE